MFMRNAMPFSFTQFIGVVQFKSLLKLLQATILKTQRIIDHNPYFIICMFAQFADDALTHNFPLGGIKCSCSSPNTHTTVSNGDRNTFIQLF